MAQPARPEPRSERMGLQSEQRAELRTFIKQSQMQSEGSLAPVGAMPLPPPGAPMLSQGQHQELRQTLRQQRIENIRQQP